MTQRIVPLLLLLTLVWILPNDTTPATVEAGTVGTFTFTITGVMPTIEQPDPTSTTTTTPCSSMLNFGRSRRYEVHSFVAASTGVYDFVTSNIVSGSSDNELLLYQNVFVPNDQSSNCLVGNDNDGANPQAALRNVNLVGGQTYFLVGFPKFESVTAGILSDTTFEVNVTFVAPLQAVAVCNGDNLQVNIQNGDGPFSVSALANGTLTTRTDLSIGLHTFTGPANFTNISVTEQSVDNEVLNLPDRNCPPPPPGITVTPGGDTTVDEANLADTATFSVVLQTLPGANVVINVATDGQCTITSPFSGTSGSLVFTDLNGTTPQSVTVIATDDVVDEASPHPCHIILTMDTVNTLDPGYAALDPDDVSINVSDNDTAGLLATPNVVTTDESGTTDTFDVTLTSQPTDNVVITVTSQDTTEGTVDLATLTFMPGDWNVPQTITVTGVDEFVDDGDIIYNIDLAVDTVNTLDPVYQSLAPTATVSATNTDDDTVGVSVAPLTVSTDESGTTDAFEVVLLSEPTGNVVINVTSQDTSEGVVDLATLTFTPAIWDTPQTVTVTGQDDFVQDGDVNYLITLAIDTVNTIDPLYDALVINPVSATNTDDDIPNVRIIEITISTDESGTAATFDVVLNTQPIADVTVTISGLDSSEGSLSDASLTFTDTDWNMAQTVTVTGQDDNVDDGDILYTLTATSSSAGDPDYGAGLTDSVDVTNVDDDETGITLDDAVGLETDEGGNSASFSVVLNSEPTGNVIINIDSNDTTEGTVGPASLLFTTSNWQTAQTVTVTGIDDALPDGDVAYTIVFSVDGSTTDAFYATLAPVNVNVTNVDNDTDDLQLSPNILLVAEDAPGENVISITLRTPPQPGEVVTIVITFDDTQLDISPIVLTFDSSNYNIPQVVSVDAIPDGVDEPLFDTVIVFTATSNVGSTPYNGLTGSVTVKLFDYEVEIITYVPNHGLIRIDTSQGQPTFGSPSEGVAHEPAGREIWLPQDYDGNGFDTFVVTDIRTYDGQIWLGLWQGTMNWLWVPYNLDMLSIVEPLDWHIQSEWIP